MHTYRINQSLLSKMKKYRKQKQVLITGGSGFVGHHVIEYLLNETEWSIVSLDRSSYSENLDRIEEVVQNSNLFKKRIKVVWHDLKASLNPQIVKSIGRVDYIIHLASGSHIDKSIQDPMEFVMDNVVGTANLLEYARLNLKSLKKFLYFSTEGIFGPASRGVFFRENDRYSSSNPYSATKAAGEELCISYANTYSIPIIVTHTMNVFGERQHPEKFIPKVIRGLLTNKEITIHADKKKKISGSRFYIHAKDVAEAVLFLLHKGNKGEKYNLVGAKEIHNLELAKKIAKILKKDLKYKLVDREKSRPGHDLRYALSGRKMKTMGWEPKSIDQRLKEVVNWIVRNKRWL